MKRSKQRKAVPEFQHTLNGIREQKRREREMQEAIGGNPTLTAEQYYCIRLSQIWCRPIVLLVIGMFATFLRGCAI